MDNGLWIYNAACDSHNASDDGRLWLVVNEESSEKNKLLLWIQDEKICEESGNLGFCALLFRETVACVWPGESPDLSCSVMPGARKKRASDQCGGINRFGHSDASIAGYNTLDRKGIKDKIRRVRKTSVEK